MKKPKPSEQHLTIEDDSQELSQIVPIRNETVFSQFPLHRLSKGREPLSLQITTANEKGKVITTWKVIASADYGEPGILAYKLDTLFINRLIDDARPDIPEVIKLGSLREIGREVEAGEKNTNSIKKALYQNASANIKAELSYTGNDGRSKFIKFLSSRYAVVFTGETLPNGKEADSVYIVLTPLFREVLRTAKTRPLDYTYLMGLPPTSQRLYELVSPKIYAALKFENPRAKYLYSELCQYAPLTRYENWEQVKKQLYKVHQPHKKSGYFAKIEFEDAADAEGKADWVIWYTPGRKAKSEFRRFNTKEGQALGRQRPSRPHLVTMDLLKPALIESQVRSEEESREELSQPMLPLDEDLTVNRLTEAGVTESVARKLANAHREECERQLEALPYRERVKDKGAYLVRAIREQYAMPSGMQAAKQEEQDAIRRTERIKQQEAEQARQRAGELYVQFFTPSFRAHQKVEIDMVAESAPEVFEQFKVWFEDRHKKTFKVIKSEARREEIRIANAAEFFSEVRPDLGIRLTSFDEWDDEHNPDQSDPVEWFNAEPQEIFAEMDRRLKAEY